MSEGKTMRIVVLDGRRDRHADAVTAAIARAFDVEERQADVAPPSGRGGAAATVEDVLHAADAAVVLDSGSLLRAKDAGVAMCAVVFPGFDLAFGGDLADADRVVVAHPRLVPHAIRRGARKGTVEVAGPVPPIGYALPDDRRAARESVGLDPDRKLVLVPGATLEEHGAEAILVQLSLVADDAGFLFDVGVDAEIADAIRRLAPLHGLTAWIFSEEPGCERYYELADVAVVRARGYEVARALAVGAPLVVLPPGRSDTMAAQILEDLGVGNDAEVLATLAVAIDRALVDDALSEGRAAIAALDMEGAAARVAEVVRSAWHARRAAGEDRPRGLPHGLEAISVGEEVHEAQPESRGSLEALEDRIERELAELKRKLEDD